MKKVLKYGDKIITIEAYTTLQERDILLCMASDFVFDDIFNILQSNISINHPYTIDTLSYVEKFYILLELRMISVSEIFSFVKKCDKCNEHYEIDISYNKTIKEGNLQDYKGIHLYDIYSNTDDYNKYTDIDLDDLDIEYYDDVISYIEENRTKFDFIKETKCTFCGNKSKIELSETHLLENLSEDTLVNYYQSIASLVYYGHYTKLDIDSMLPFERSLYISILNEEIKKLNIT